MIKNHYIVVDVETQISPEAGQVSGPGGKANPYGGAGCVYLGYKEKGDNVVTTVHTLGNAQGFDRIRSHPGCSDTRHPVILVGHNICFDLHHIFHGVDEHEIPTFTIWDTQTVEYYLHGQAPEVRWNSLDALSENYGCQLKDSKISDYFKAGIGADKIPEDEVVPYLVNDVEVTETIFLKQFEKAKELCMLPFLRQMLDAQCATWMMERNGMLVNNPTVSKIEGEYTLRRQELDKDLASMWVGYFPKMEEKQRNPDSNQQLLQVLTSGEYKYRLKQQVTDAEGKPVFYKNGNPRVRYFDFTEQCAGYGLKVTEVGEKTLSGLVGTMPTKRGGLLVKNILELRKLRKILDTYVSGYLRKTDEDGVLRTNYNHTATPTGRVSSSNPNLQNLPKG